MLKAYILKSLIFYLCEAEENLKTGFCSFHFGESDKKIRTALSFLVTSNINALKVTNRNTQKELKRKNFSLFVNAVKVSKQYFTIFVMISSIKITKHLRKPSKYSI
jgi:hypothetical protein